MRFTSLTLRLSLLLLQFIAAAAFALDWESADYRLLDAEALRQASAKATLQNYPDADVVRLDSSTLITYAADGTFFQVVDLAEKVLTEKGCKESKVLASYYDTAYSRAKIPLVQILHPDGTATDVDLKQFSEDIINNSDMEHNIYGTDSRMIRVTIPEVAPGDVIRAIYVDETLKPRVPGAFYDHFSLEAMVPMLRTTIVIDGPEALPLKQIAIRNLVGKVPPEHKVEHADGRIRYTWQFSAIPQAFAEPDMPPLYACGQNLLVSTFSTWQEVSKWYWELSEPHLKADDAITLEVTELTAGLYDFESKLRAIFDFVSQQIRYMGIIDEKNAPGYEPHDVTRTFANRAGVCRDKAALLAAMLRLAGMEAYPVLIHTAVLKDAEVPMPAFNHAITAVRRPDGAIQLLDSTAENTRELFPSYLSGRSYLMATPEGSPLMTSSITPYTKNLSSIRSTATLQTDGTLSMESELIFNGIDDRAYRGFFLSAAPDQQRLFFERQISRMVPGAKLTSLRLFPEDLQDTGTPLRARFTLETPQVLVLQNQPSDKDELPPDGTLALLRLPRLAGGFGLLHNVFGGATLEERRFPMQAAYTIGMDEELSLFLPEGLKVKSLPAFTPIETPEVLFKRQISSFPGRILYRNTMASKTMEYTPSQYGTLKDSLKLVESDSRKMPILEYSTQEEDSHEGDLLYADTNDKPDAEILEETTTIRFISETCWTTTRKVKCRILTYQGSRDCAELTFNYMPLCQDVELESARVINGDQVLEPDKNMIHTMDMPNGTAPRYPIGKCLAVNLPGVEIGSVIEYEVVRQEFNRPFASEYTVLQNNYPAVERTLVIDAPAQMDIEPELLENGWLDCAIKGPRRASRVLASERTDKEGERRIFTWNVRHMPADYREFAQLPSYAYLPTVCFSNGKWRDYAAMLRKTIEELGDGGEAVARQAAEFQEASGYDRLRQLWNWFDRNIRSAGPAFNTLPLECLSRPEVTLRERYGNSADRAILLAAMLRAAGFQDVQLYLANSDTEHEDLQNFRATFPGTGFSGTILVRVLCEGHEVWLNDQSRYLRFGTCDHDRGLLLSIDNGGLSRMTLPTSLAEHTETSTHLELSDDGSARFSIQQSLYGTKYGRQKKYFLELQPEERKRAYQKTMAALSQNAVPVTPDYVVNFDDYPGTVSYTADIKGYAVADGDYYYLRLPLSPEGLFPGANAEKRMTPLYWGNRLDETRTLTVVLPPSFQQVDMVPSDHTWKAPGGGGTIHWRCNVVQSSTDQPSMLEITMQVQRKPAVILPNNYAEVRDDARQMDAPQYATVLLKRTGALQAED